MMSFNETARESRRYFAIASLGKGRWYWVVWPSLHELQAAASPLSHIAEGLEAIKADAVEKALDVAGMYATWIAAKYAKAYYQNTRASTTAFRDRSGSLASTGLPVLSEFLYRDIYDPATRQWISMPHRIVRRTSKFVFVEQRPHSPQDSPQSFLEGEPPAYRLDRQALEQQGFAYIPATAILTDQEEPVFFVSEHHMLQSSQVPACLQLLHLSWPCTVTEVQEAYRKLVKSAHPDGGGSHDQFIEIQAAYEQALRLCQ